MAHFFFLSLYTLIYNNLNILFCHFNDLNLICCTVICFLVFYFLILTASLRYDSHAIQAPV